MRPNLETDALAIAVLGKGPRRDAFMNKHEVSESGCWVWSGGRIPSMGRARCFIRRGKRINAARAMWLLVNGPIADGLHVAHRCDNPMCVCPEHLFLATHAENMRDMVIKGRSRKGCKGPGHFSVATKEEARRRYAGGETAQMLADEYGVHITSFFQWVRGYGISKKPGPVRRIESHA